MSTEAGGHRLIQRSSRDSEKPAKGAKFRTFFWWRLDGTRGLAPSTDFMRDSAIVFTLQKGQRSQGKDGRERERDVCF